MNRNIWTKTPDDAERKSLTSATILGTGTVQRDQGAECQNEYLWSEAKGKKENETRITSGFERSPTDARTR